MLAKLWIKMKGIPFLHAFGKFLFESFCQICPPLRKVFYNLGTSPDGLDFGTGDMAKDWDTRSKKNAKWYIYWDAWKTDEEFDQSGEREVKEIVLKDLPFNEQSRVLEIGCGIGRLLKPLSRYVGEVYGVDISKEMISQGKERLKSQKNIFLSVCNGTLADFKEEFFDLCYSLAVFRHIPEKKYIYQYFSEASRVLKKNGHFRFEVWGANASKSRDKGGTLVGVSFTEEEIRKKMDENGFKLLGAEKRPNLPYVVYTAIKIKARNGTEERKTTH